MANKKKSRNNPEPLEIIALIVAGLYMQSVLTVAHNTSLMPQDGSTYTVGPPSVPFLILGILLVGYNCYKEKRLGILNAVSLTILVTASIFWLSGLRANFFF